MYMYSWGSVPTGSQLQQEVGIHVIPSQIIHGIHVIPSQIRISQKGHVHEHSYGITSYYVDVRTWQKGSAVACTCTCTVHVHVSVMQAKPCLYVHVTCTVSIVSMRNALECEHAFVTHA